MFLFKKFVTSNFNYNNNNNNIKYSLQNCNEFDFQIKQFFITIWSLKFFKIILMGELFWGR